MDPKQSALIKRDADRLTWDPRRTQLALKIEAKWFQNMVGVLILVSCGVMLWQTDARASGTKEAQWEKRLGRVLSLLYLVELSLRLYVYRGWFFHALLPPFKANMLDFAIVMGDVVIEVAGLFLDLSGGGPFLSFLRMLRIFRLARFLRILSMFDKLRMFIKLYAYAISSIVWAAFIFICMIMVWSVVAVEMVHPLNKDIEYDVVHCERCARAFDSIFQSTLTLLILIVGGDGWSYLVLPIVEAYPLLMLLFGGVLISVQIGMMNLMIAMIISSAEISRQEDIKEVLLQKDMDFVKARKALNYLYHAIDDSGDGSVSLFELQNAYCTNVEFREIMQSLDVEEQDISLVFQIMDDDASGHVSFDEFVHQLHNLRTQDTRSMLIFVKAYLTDVRLKVSESVDWLKGRIAQHMEQNQKHLENLHQSHLEHRGEWTEHREEWAEHRETLRRSMTIEPKALDQRGDHPGTESSPRFKKGRPTAFCEMVADSSDHEARDEARVLPDGCGQYGKVGAIVTEAVTPVISKWTASKGVAPSITVERTKAMQAALQDMVNIANELQILDGKRVLEVDGPRKENKAPNDADDPSQCSGRTIPWPSKRPVT